MSYKTLTALILLSLPMVGHAATWTGISSNDWAVDGNWMSPMTYPDSPTDTANFAGASPLSINLTGIIMDPEVQTLNFSGANYTFPDTGGILLLAPGTSTAINVTGSQTNINCPVGVNNEMDPIATTVTITVTGANDLLAFNNTAVRDGSAFPPVGSEVASLVVTGLGTLQMNDTPCVFLGSGTIDAVTLDFTNTASTPTIFFLCSGMAFINTPSNFVLTGTTAVLTNNANIQPTTDNIFGCAMLAENDFTINGGSINIVNNGQITHLAMPIAPNSVGAGIDAGQTFLIEGGATVTITDNGGHDAFSFGAGIFVSQGTMNLSNGTIVNNGQIAVPSLTIGTNSILAGGTIPTSNNGGIIKGQLIGQADMMGNPPLINTTVTNNGAIIPGDPIAGGNPGTIDILGTYNHASTATLVVNILNSTPGNFSQVSVADDGTMTGGVVNLMGGTVKVALTPGYSISTADQFPIIAATASINGALPALDSSLLPAGYVPYLFFTADPHLILAFLSVPGSTTACPTLTSYVGNVAQPIFSGITDGNVFLKRKIQNLQGRMHYECPKPSKNKKCKTKKEQPVACPKLNAYIGPLGAVGGVHKHGTQVGFTYNSVGGLAGIDYAFSQLGIGVMGSYERTKGHGHNHWGKFDYDQAHGSLYATYTPKSLPQLAFDAIAGGSYEWYSISRSNTTGTAKGKPHGAEFDALAGVEYTIEKKGLQIIPMALVQYIYLDIDRYKEHGGGVNSFKIHSQHIKSLSTILGSWINYSWKWTDHTFTLSTDFAWQREYSNQSRSLYFSLANPSALTASCPAFTSATGAPASAALKLNGARRNTLLVGVDLLFMLFDRYGFEASYDFQWNKQIRDNHFYVGFNAEF